MTHRTPPPAKMFLPALFASLALTAASPPPAAAAQDRSWDRYGILVERNIFRRDRGSVRSDPVATTQPREQYTYDSDGSIVLTGIAGPDGEFVASFEDTRTEAVIRARVGQPVGKGNVTLITLDEVQYERDGTARRIEIGCSLTGKTATAPATQPAATGQDSPGAGRDEPTTKPAEPATDTRPAPSGTSPAATTDSDISKIREQLRRQREQELRR